MAKTTANEILSVDNPVFSTFVYYAALLIIKMMMMTMLTVFHRLRTKVFFKTKRLGINENDKLFR